jgi:NAD(P)-dependent dehydrogenase (short-subunit alcohol dehydrogenase family)
MSNLNTQNIRDQKSKVAIITGVTSGIGRAASYLLSDLGYQTVYLVGRNLTKLEDLKTDLNNKFKNLELILKVADLADFKEVQILAEELKLETKNSGIDLFINNAGIGQDTRLENPQGFELNLATNCLSQVILTEKLISNLNQDSFTIFTSSEAYLGAKIDFENMNLEQNFSMFRAYGNSKAYQMMYAKLLRSRQENREVKNLHFEAIHPGLVDTGFGATTSNQIIQLVMKFIRLFALSSEKSAKENLLAPIYPENQDRLDKADIWSKGKPVITKKTFMEKDELEKLWKYSQSSLENFL